MAQAKHCDGSDVSQSWYNATMERIVIMEMLIERHQRAFQKVVDFHNADHEHSPAGDIQDMYDDMIDEVRTLLSPNRAKDAERYKYVILADAVRRAIDHAGGRESEWGERAEECFRILERGLESA